MAQTPTDQEQTMIANLERDSGKALSWWLDLIDSSGLAKHGERVGYLKTEHQLGHGYANLVVHLAKRRASGDVAPTDLVEAQYHGKESLRPIYETVVSLAQGFGDDVEVAPKKASVSLRRAKQFALVEPATKTRVDLGLNLKGREPTERLESATGMCTHKVRLTDAGQVDEELIGWLRAAYDQAG